MSKSIVVVPSLFGTNFSLDQKQGWFGDESSTLHLLCALFLLLLRQLHLRPSGIRSWRLGTPKLEGLLDRRQCPPPNYTLRPMGYSMIISCKLSDFTSSCNFLKTQYIIYEKHFINQNFQAEQGCFAKRIITRVRELHFTD